MNDWQNVVRATLDEEAERLKERERKRRNELIEHAEHTNTPVGKLLRSKKARRYIKTGREVIYVSFQIPLADHLRAESRDCKISMSQFIATLCAIAFPIWEEYRREFLYEGQSAYIPMRAKAILTQAYNPNIPRTPHAINAWHDKVTQNILATRKPKRQKKIDPTEAMLAGLPRDLKDSE